MTEISHFGKDMKELLQEKVYVINVLGWISFQPFHNSGTSIICIELVLKVGGPLPANPTIKLS
jgi:hypothetical protein